MKIFVNNHGYFLLAEEYHEDVVKDNPSLFMIVEVEEIPKGDNLIFRDGKFIQDVEVENFLFYIKQSKADELKNAFEQEMTKSPLEVENIGTVDAGRIYMENINTLIDIADDVGIKFRMFDNSFKTLNLEELKRVKKALQVAGVKAHTKKWQLEATLEKATTKEEVEAIKW